MVTLVTFALTALLLASRVHAANDPSIPAERKAEVQKAMTAHINSNRVGDQYVIYDAVAGKLLRLHLKELHAGVVLKGEFYVSCADFTDAGGNLVDVDFRVGADSEGHRVLEGVVHKIGGTKRPYHIEEKQPKADD